MRYLSLIAILYFITATTNDQYKKMDGNNLKKYLLQQRVYIIDTREAEVSSEGYLPNSLLMPLSMDYSKWMGTVVRTPSQVIIITDKDNYGRAIQKVKEAGYTILGYAIFDEILNQFSYNIQKALYQENTKELVEKLVKEKKYILDLREDEECEETGIIENSKSMPISTLNRRYTSLPDDDIYLLCKTEERALLAMSFLEKAKVRNNLYIMRGGIDKTIREGFALVKSTDSKEEK